MGKKRFLIVGLFLAFITVCYCFNNINSVKANNQLKECVKTTQTNQEEKPKIIIVKKEITPPNENGWSKVMDALTEIESGGDSTIVSKSGKYVGVLQIAPIIVKECNQILKAKGETKRYTLNDRLSVRKSREMFVLIQEKYNPEHNIEKGIRLWNGGTNYSHHATQHYYKKVVAKL